MRVLRNRPHADAQLADARQRFKVGLIPPNEVSSLEAQRSREQAQFFEAGNIRESALIELRRLIGVGYDTVIDLADPLEQASPDARDPKAAQELIKSALESRPERKALVFRLGGLEAKHQAALTGNKPTLNLIGGVDYANPNPRIFPQGCVAGVVGHRRQRQLELLRFRTASRRSG